MNMIIWIYSNESISIFAFIPTHVQNVILNIFFYFPFLATSRNMEFPGQGSDLSHSCSRSLLAVQGWGLNLHSSAPETLPILLCHSRNSQQPFLEADEVCAAKRTGPRILQFGLLIQMPPPRAVWLHSYATSLVVLGFLEDGERWAEGSQGSKHWKSSLSAQRQDINSLFTADRLIAQRICRQTLLN